MVPNSLAEELSSVPKCKKAAMCLPESTLEKLHSAMSYGAAGLEFIINESTIYIQ